LIFKKILARTYFSVTGYNIEKGRRREEEKLFLFPTWEMGADSLTDFHKHV
jgi:hypothetical protein